MCRPWILETAEDMLYGGAQTGGAEDVQLTRRSPPTRSPRSASKSNFHQAPPNSFFSPLAFSSQSFRLSQHINQRQPSWRASTASGVLNLSELLRDSKLDSSPDQDLPRLYSLTDPLSELGLVVHNSNAHPNSSYLSSSYGASTVSRLEALPKDEEVIFVSSKSEVLTLEEPYDQPLLFVVTANRKSGRFSLWQMFYLFPLPASSSNSGTKESSFHGTSKPRRRSSFIPGTGATTPLVRVRDVSSQTHNATSKTATSRSRTAPASFSASQQSRDAEAEDALASQLDPDNEIPGMTGNVKESRRVSSLLSRADLSTSYDRNAFQEMATQRTSLGFSQNSQTRNSHVFSHYADRTSLGVSQSSYSSYRGDIAADRLSLGVESVDETLEDLLTPGGEDLMEDAADVEFAARLGSYAVQEPISGLRREIVLSKFGEIPISEPKSEMKGITEQPPDGFRVFIHSVPKSIQDDGSQTHQRYVHIMEYASKRHIKINFEVRRRSIRSAGTSRQPAIQHFPSAWVKDVAIHSNCIDAIVARDKSQSCLITIETENNQTTTLALQAAIPIELELDKLRLFDPFAAIDKSVAGHPAAGQNRRIDPPKSITRLVHAGSSGQIDIQAQNDQLHKFELQLQPRNESIARALHLFQALLPGPASSILTTLWWEYARRSLTNYRPVMEWDAYVMAIFTFVVCTLPAKPSENGGRLDRTRKQTRKSDALGSAVPHGELPVLEYLNRPGARSRSHNAWGWIEDRLNTAQDSNPYQRGNDIFSTYVSQIQQYLSTFTGSKIRTILVENGYQLLRETVPLLVYILHILREEQKLDIASPEQAVRSIGDTSVVIAQLCGWLGWDKWSWKDGSWYAIDSKQMGSYAWDTSMSTPLSTLDAPFDQPPGVFEWLESAITSNDHAQFPTLTVVLHSSQAVANDKEKAKYLEKVIEQATPRLEALARYIKKVHDSQSDAVASVELMQGCKIDRMMLETFPEAVSALLRESVARCQASPPTAWDPSLLQLVSREDLNLASQHMTARGYDVTHNQQLLSVPRDVHQICESAERVEPLANAALADGSMITRLIFSQDQRFLEALKLVEPLRTQIANCPPDPSWSDQEVLEAQKTVVQYVMTRTFAIAPAQAMVYFDSRRPLPTEKFAIHGYTTMCVMKPMNITVTANREGFTEERYAWAYFHAGVSAGLSISKNAEGIDTSWIVFNKPNDLTNRHAGLLLGLGLTGHLKNLAKWLSFKYLTPKHTMTSVGLLLGLSTAFLGTMDALVTRLLSVHVTRMLPPGAAELNLNPLTQTTGVMGIGLLYCNTQHRRMSEVLLSEIEHVSVEDPFTGPDVVRDEGYRLAAGFALGFINLAKGNELKGLHDMRVVERLLAVAVGPRPVDLVHVLDQATAGATIAITLIFMKTGNAAVAKKVDIPDTLPQFDFVRPDILLLRTMAKHLIMWDNITPSHTWVQQNLPRDYANDHLLKSIRALKSSHMPFFNILAGLLWSISLKYAGSGNTTVRDFLLHYLDQFIRICHLSALRYDAKLARNTVRNCQDLVALAAATVMAGTGDLPVFRRLRLLHGRVNADTPYGSHLAAHMAIGVLFLASGRYTFSTTPLAIASLICAFYPLFPQDVLDNKAHLQAFRHLWVLAAEARCLIVRDLDTHRAIPMPLQLTLKDGQNMSLSSPCLLPELESIASLRTTSTEYWPVTLDLVNPTHLSHLRKTQTLQVRRRPATATNNAVFSSMLAALNDASTRSHLAARLNLDWLFSLPLFSRGQLVQSAEWALVLPFDQHSGVYSESRGTVVDHKLGLVLAAKGNEAERLWGLRVLFAWAGKMGEVEREAGPRWLGAEVVEEVKSRVMERGGGSI